jgi:hypothetical protein
VENGGLAMCLDAIAVNCPKFERLSLTFERPQLISTDVIDIITDAREC